MVEAMGTVPTSRQKTLNTLERRLRDESDEISAGTLDSQTFRVDKSRIDRVPQQRRKRLRRHGASRSRPQTSRRDGTECIGGRVSPGGDKLERVADVRCAVRIWAK